MDSERKAFKAFVTIFLGFAVLVATHEGEFWPFSIYPMFSQAGKVWTRTMVREVPESLQKNPETLEVVYSLEHLPGQPFAMNQVGINQNDVSNFVEKVKNWDQEKVEGIRKLFSSELKDKSLLIYKVQGRLSSTDSDSVITSYTPFVLLSDTETIFTGD